MIYGVPPSDHGFRVTDPARVERRRLSTGKPCLESISTSGCTIRPPKYPESSVAMTDLPVGQWPGRIQRSEVSQRHRARWLVNLSRFRPSSAIAAELSQ